MRKQRNPCLDAAVQELHAAGIRDGLTIANGSKHPQLRWKVRGQLRVFAVPGTSSDYRAPENVRRDLRRILREDGLLDEHEPRATPPARQPSRLDLLERRLKLVEERLGVG